MPQFGRASLAQSCTLPPPPSPTRVRFPKQVDLLKFHGFDSSLDKRLARTADAILAETTPLHEHLEPAFAIVRSRRELVGLPCVRVRLSKALCEETLASEQPPPPGARAHGAPTAAALAEAAEARAEILRLLASLLLRCGVEASDIEASQHEDQLHFLMRLRGPSASVQTVLDVLTPATQDKKAHGHLHEAFVLAGCVEAAPAAIMIHWPLERVREEVRVAFPQYELPIGLLEKELPPFVAASWKRCATAWELVGGDTPADLQPLLEQESFARFGGEALTLAEGARRGLREDPRTQGAEDLVDLMADAAEAQRMLKDVLAQGSHWSRAQLNDPEGVPLNAEARSWLSTGSDVAPNAVHHDPGVEDRHVAFEKAKRMQRRYEAKPTPSELTDLSRLTLTFFTAAHAASGLRRLLERFEVLWLDNHFRDPAPLGYRAMALGVRQHVSAQGDLLPTGQIQSIKRHHISEITVRLRPMRDVELNDETHSMQELRALLSRCGVLPQHLEGVLARVLASFAFTEGQALREADRELVRVVKHFTNNFKALGVEGQFLTEDLADELADHALISGLPEARIAEILLAVPNLNEKRAVRTRRVALVNEVAQRLARYVGVTFEDLLEALLSNLGELPRDARGRVSLSSRWWELPQFEGIHERWAAVATGGGELRFHDECDDWRSRNSTIGQEEVRLLGRAKDLNKQLQDLCARSAADQLVQALLRFLLARSSGQTPDLSEVSRAATWARDASGASVEASMWVAEFLKWAAFEDQIVWALQGAAPSPKLLRELREALAVGDTAGFAGRCACSWQGPGTEHVCDLLRMRDARALPVAMVLLAKGATEVRAQVAEGLTNSAAVEGEWLLKVVGAGALPPLGAMLQGGRSDSRCMYSALLVLKNLSAASESRPAVSEVGFIGRCAEMVLNTGYGQDVSYLALAILNNLAKASEADAEAIREQGLKVDSVGRVKKK